MNPRALLLMNAFFPAAQGLNDYSPPIRTFPSRRAVVETNVAAARLFFFRVQQPALL
jgi:hypothetical protein